MFAPRPPDVMWWYNIEGELHDGRKAEVSNDGALWTFEPNIPHRYLSSWYIISLTQFIVSISQDLCIILWATTDGLSYLKMG